MKIFSPTSTLALLGWILCWEAGAAGYHATTTAELREYTGRLKAGDTLLVARGNYDVSTWSLSGLAGMPGQWIVLQGETGAVIRSTSGCCNLVQINDASYLRLQGLEFTMAAANGGIDGINVGGAYSHHLRFEALKIHGMTGNGISVFADSASHLELVESEISGLEGSGLYWGYPGRDIVHDVLIQGNYIHHCPVNPQAETNYGIQLKGWGYRARILDNVLHDVGGTTRSGLIVYYGRKPLAGDRPEDINIVAGNIMWNCRSEGITAMSDALIENNIVVSAATGINLQTYGDESFTGTNAVENLRVRNNTVYRAGGACIAVSGWGAARAGTVFLTGNAAYQGASSQVAFRGSTGPAVVAGNIRFGRGGGTGWTDAAGLGDFLAAAPAAIPGLDLFPAPGSRLRDVVDAALCPGIDFNGSPRPSGTSCDAGAYEAEGSANPDWKPTMGFKGGMGSVSAVRGDAPSGPPGGRARHILRRSML